MTQENAKPKVSIILPCQNEQAALAFCLQKIKSVIKENGILAEIIVSDSSTDKSPEIAKKEGVILLKHDKDGYGAAYLEAFKIAKGEHIFMADADGTYDFSEIPSFLKELKNFDFIIGNRFGGKIESNAMPFLNRYVGNPILSGILRIFFFTKIKDSHSGMRAVKKSALTKMRLQTTGMEFASEMVIKAIRNNLKIKEIPINYYHRKGQSKLRPFSDAWKHMRFMLLYSPLFLFFIPGILLFFFGLFTMLWPHISNKNFFISALMTIIGYQLIVFSMFAKTYSIVHLREQSPLMDKLYRYITIEKASVLGIITAVFGIIIYFLLPNYIISLTLITIGIQTIFSSFMLSILGIKEK